MKAWTEGMAQLVAALMVVGSVTVYAGGEEKKETYPIDVCIVSGMKLGSMGEPYAHAHEGRTVHFCCAGCIDPFEANAEEMLKKLDRKIVAQQKETYPLDRCVVSGEELGSHGAIIDIVHEHRLVRLCCEGCLTDFERDPDAFLKKLDAARAGDAGAVPVVHEQEHHEHHHEHDHHQ